MESQSQITAGQSSHLAAGGPAVCRYLSREPILDRRGCVHGYELLSRSGPVPEFSGDGFRATEMMIDNSLLFGLQHLTCGSPAFINCTAETLLRGEARVLPPAMTVLEILESVPPDPAIVEVCRELKKEGYRLALDDFVYRPELKPLIRVADFIKIDFLSTTAAQRSEFRCRIPFFNGALIAERVETQESYSEACAEGFPLFQGFYFCRPLVLKEQKVPANQAVHLKLLAMLRKDPLDLAEIEEIVKLEPALAYRLLRYVNSPVHGIRGQITSIRSALMIVGDELFRRIVLLAVASDFNKNSCGEILRMALVRARFCESTAALYNFDSTEQYLLGLFSLLSAMLQSPIDQAVAALPLREPLREALLGESNALRSQLEWIEAYECGDFERSDALAQAQNMNPAVLSENFTNAVLWADQLLAE